MAMNERIESGKSAGPRVETIASGAAKRKMEDAPAKKPKASKASKATLRKFQRGLPVATRKIADKKLKGKMRYAERLAEEALSSAAKTNEWLLPLDAGALVTQGMERTYRISQETIVQEAEVGAAEKVFDLSLGQLGPYCLDFTRSGRYMVLGGRAGHLAVLEWQRTRLISEIQVKEVTHDVKFLHNELFYAAAQKKYVYIYDKRGLEVHCLKESTQVRKLDFLPYHFLLVSIGDQGILRYQDTTTGHIVAQYRTRKGPCHVMRQNPWNAVMCLGHANGTVTMWAPNMGTPLVTQLCHRGPVRALAIDNMGRYMATAGADGQVTIFDVRNTYQPISSYYSHAPADCLDISQRGLLAVAHGRSIQIWKDALEKKQYAPYMTHTLTNGVIRDFHFCPYEDVAAMGHTGGLSTMLVPGAGEPNFDSFVADPFQGYKARREQEVAQLLDKLPPDSICLDPSLIGQVRKEPAEAREERARQLQDANKAKKREQEQKNDEKTRMKGKNKASRRAKKKQDNIITEKKVALREKLREQGLSAEHGRHKKEEVVIPEDVPRSLHRFFKKGGFE